MIKVALSYIYLYVRKEGWKEATVIQFLSYTEIII